MIKIGPQRSILGPVLFSSVLLVGPRSCCDVRLHVSCEIWELWLRLSERDSHSSVPAGTVGVLSVRSHVFFMMTKQRHGCTGFNVTLMRLYEHKWSCWRSRFVVRAGARGKILDYFRVRRWQRWPADTTRPVWKICFEPTHTTGAKSSIYRLAGCSRNLKSDRLANVKDNKITRPQIQVKWCHLFRDGRRFGEAVKGEDKCGEAPKFQFKVCLMSFMMDAQVHGLLFSGVTVCCSIVTHNFGVMTTLPRIQTYIKSASHSHPGRCRAPPKWCGRDQCLFLFLFNTERMPEEGCCRVLRQLRVESTR